MKRACLGATFVVLLVGGFPAFGQDDDSPPQIVNVTWEIARNQDIDPLGPFEPFVPFDPATEIAREADLILITVEISDDELPDSADDGIFIRKRSLWWPYFPYYSPEPPPVEGDTVFFVSPRYIDIGTETVTCIILFTIPQWDGVNQARMREFINWDVRWQVLIEVCADEDPDEGTPVSIWPYVLYAVENTAFRPANPPSFADAGADQVVPVGVEVTLDGSRTFDSFNVGFDMNDENVYEKDNLTFTWEWLSGPVRVDPAQTGPHDPTATVTLAAPGHYVYRLLVDDNVNALPSTDTVTITAGTLPERNPPRAVIRGPASAVPVGSIVILASESTDPDGDELEHRWQQTDELGGPLAADGLQDAFQPLSGMTEDTLTWQALKVGTYHFRLLVDDGYFRSSARFSVEVIDTVTSAASAAADESNDDAGATSGQAEPGPALCGAGILPLAALPLALCLVRRRCR